MPYIEQGALYNQLAGTQPLLGVAVATPAMQTLLQTPLATFRCPSDSGGNLNILPGESHFIYGLGTTGEPWFINGSIAGPKVALATSNYVALHSHRMQQYSGNSLVYSGSFGPNRTFKMGSISDGTSNTICVGERAYQVGSVVMAAAVWAGCAAAAHDDCIDDSWATGIAPINPTQPVFVTATGKYARQQALSSNHTGGAMVGLFDGSVHFLSQSVDFNMGGSGAATNTTVADSVYEYLIQKDDGQVVGEF